MSKVIVASLPDDSLLRQRMANHDFLDCYCINADIPVRQAAEIVANFPVWAQYLLKLRNVLTKPFGLSNDTPDTADHIGIFPVVSENSVELLAGFNDKHLDFLLSVISRNGQVYLSTWVHTHNIGGRIYLAAIMPFHILIVRNSLERVRAASLA